MKNDFESTEAVKNDRAFVLDASKATDFFKKRKKSKEILSRWGIDPKPQNSGQNFERRVDMKKMFIVIGDKEAYDDAMSWPQRDDVEFIFSEKHGEKGNGIVYMYDPRLADWW